MALLYNKALVEVRKYPNLINDMKTLQSIKFVGVKTAVMLKNKLISHCKSQGIEIPRGFLNDAEKHTLDLKKQQKRSVLDIDLAGDDNDNEKDARPAKKPKRVTAPKEYVPKHRSGGFAILLALYLTDSQAQRGMIREEIATAATPYCDKALTSNAAAGEYYSAWNSIKTLIKQDLVTASGRVPKQYFLTDKGRILAEKLRTTEGIQQQPLDASSSSSAGNSNIAEISFDNGIRYESSFEKSSPITKKTTNILQQNDGLLYSSPLSKPPIVLHNPAHNNKLIQEALSSSRNANTSMTHDPQSRNLDGVKYEIWSRTEYEIILIIDNREIRSHQERDYFSKRLDTFGIKCEVRPLSAGDAVWIARNYRTGKEAILNYICERKRLDDLASSITDGRFQEQKNRLKKTGMKHCYYIIEDMATSVDRVHNLADSIQTAVSQTITNSNLYLRRFRDINETTAFLASNTQVIDDLTKEKNLILIKPNNIKNQDEYSQLMLKFRNKFETKLKNEKYECVHQFQIFQEMMGKSTSMTVKEIFLLMLMSIRGVSLEKAIVIQNKFPTPKSLLEFYHVQHRDSSEDIKKSLMMEEFKFQVGNKKIGKVVSEKIYDIWGK
ncbi:MUS81 [[Candida] subhashii]|uniref:Crossover junction endonuclease MUS81 n=1 Tax=[Candida] subhashii TaxID=561895 RepID=A0A8J5QI68_9ASCO|nr:MUS81 [[Candida] subhashii]KAG7662454.1 MUS81 [[Candida] subhashii]